MAPSFLLGCALVALVPLAKASHFITRQAARDDIQLYTKQVRSALEAIDGIRDNNASEACADTTYASRLNERDFDRQLAQTLLCEEAAGIRIFPNIDQAQRIFGAAYTGLTADSSPQFGPDDDQSFFCEGDGSEETTYLDNAGLDGPSIRDIVCPDSSLPPAATSTMSTLQTRSDLVSITATRSATVSEAPTASLSATSEGQSSTATGSSPSSSTVPASESSSSSIQLFSSTSRTSSRTSAPSTPSTSLRSQPSTSSSRTPSSTETRPPPPPSPFSTQSAPATTPPTTPPSDPPLIVVTTFVTVTVSDTPRSVSTPLPPLRFTLQSRVVPTEDPTLVTSRPPVEETDLPTWTLGPPLSFAQQSSRYPASLSDPKLENGTSLPVSCTSS